MKIFLYMFSILICLILVWFIIHGYFKSETNKNLLKVKLTQFTNKNITYSNKKIKHVPKYMLDLYEKSKMDRENMENDADIVRSIIPAYGGSHNIYLLQNDVNNNHHLLVFHIPNANKNEIFLKAELQILTLIETNSKLSFGLERLIKISLYNETTNELKVFEEKHIFHSENTWIKFNVSNAVQTAIFSNHKILKLVISVQLYKPGILKLSLMPEQENYEHDYPVLLLFYSTGKLENIRKRRFVDEDYEEETNKIWDEEGKINKKMRRMRNNCRRRPLYIDFAEIDYDSWIVQPSGYEAYQCAGKCFYPVADHLSPTKHAIMQALLHSVSPMKVPRSCCVPTKLDSISVLYVDAQGVLTYRYAYKDMVVTECGCR